MDWNPQMEVHYINTGVPYSSTGSFMDFFEGLTYENVNSIFVDMPYTQENSYPSVHSSAYKFGFSEPGSLSYYDYGHAYAVRDHTSGIDEYSSHMENSRTISDDRNVAMHTQGERNSNSTTHVNPVECPRAHHNTHDYQVIWQDNVDPDNMTYEELLELGEAVGTQSRGLSQEHISLLPISKFKCGFFRRKKHKDERCVICQMEYKRGDRRITLPCKHIYHAGCGSKWLSINKACPICYKEVFAHASKQISRRRSSNYGKLGVSVFRFYQRAFAVLHALIWDNTRDCNRINQYSD